MKTDLTYLDDDNFQMIISEWEEYAQVSTFDLMDRYDAMVCESIDMYAREERLMNLIQFYHLDDSINALREFILSDGDFEKACTCDNFEWAVDMFLENIEEQLRNGDCIYFIPNRDLGISYLSIDYYGDSVYWNIDEVWAYWKGLNEENYFEQ